MSNLLVSMCASGALVGYLSEKLTTGLITKKEKKFATIHEPYNMLQTAIWVMLHAMLWGTISLVGKTSVYSSVFALILSVCFILSVIDLLVKKLPNELLLLLIVLGITLIFTGGSGRISMHLIGLAAGLILFMLPAAVGKGAGFGDVKFAAVTGFVLGIYGLFMAVLIMSAVMVMCALYLKFFQRGGIHTKVALGPCMALGFAGVMVVNSLTNEAVFTFQMFFK